MNTKWLKQNLLLVGFIVGFLALLGAVIWLQQSASSKEAEVNASLEEQTSQYQHLQQSKPAPTKENIAIIKKDREELSLLYSNLLASVTRNKVETPADLRPVGFLQLMASSFSKLHQAADGVSIKLPDNFAFGFGRYAGPPPTLPARGLSEDESKRVLGLLVKQLRAIEQISALLIDSHVDEITQIRRAEVEAGGSAGTATAGGGTELADLSAPADPKALYQVLPFEFQFASSGDALRSFLNSVTKSDWFFAVRRVQVTGEVPASDKPTSGAGSTAAAASSITPKNYHVNVVVRIDLIEFPSPQPPKEAPAKPSGRGGPGQPPGA